jgi:acyl-CoA synthetase (AMP-forming)/AMP-acid ligase II
MFHVAALTTVIFCAMRGVSPISMPQFDPAKAWSLIVDERISIGGAVPAILNFMRQLPEFADGYLNIKDRLKDMIISGGENIYPAEIENVVIGIPGVSEVVVIGWSDQKWGEIACAIVVADQTKVSEQQIVEFCATRLARYKLPQKVIFADTIPRNPSGKIPKIVLREQY